MNNILHRLLILLLFLICFGILPINKLATSAFSQSTLMLSASQDNTLYENMNGNTSNGKGEFLFIGRNNRPTNSIRRALIQFDLTGLRGMGHPDSVALELSINRTADTAIAPISLHLIQKAWGEGNSDAPASESEGDSALADDATWIYAKYDTASWDTPGGDFVAATSALDTLNENSTNILFSSQEMLAEVLNALQNGDSSISWIIIGDESRNQSARKINSRESPMEEKRPSLFVRTAPATSITDEIKEEIQVFPNPLSSNQLFIESEKLRGEEVSIRLLTMTGEIIYRGNLHLFVGKERISLSKEGLSKGVYILSIRFSADNFIQKLIIN